MSEREKLIVAAASKVHEDWCTQELKAFFERVREIHKENPELFGDSFRKACEKNGKKRNEIELDAAYLAMHETLAIRALTDFNSFMKLVDAGAIEVKRFVGRNLTDAEMIKAGNNYRNGEENILRSFLELSAESKKENLDAAIGAYNVFVEFSKAGITVEHMLNDENLTRMIGIAIHTDWLKRNPNHENESLKVPYDELDEWTQGQDITVFKALLEVVMKNKDKFLVNVEPGFQLPNYLEEEKVILESMRQTTKKVL